MANLEYNVAGQAQTVALMTKGITYLSQDGAGIKTGVENTNAEMCFYRSKRYFVLLGLNRSGVFVNECKITILKIIREGDHLVAGPISVTFREVAVETLVAGSELIAKRMECRVCMALYKLGDSVVYCPECRAACHAKCWELVKRVCPNGQACNYQSPWDEPAKDPA